MTSWSDREMSPSPRPTSKTAYPFANSRWAKDLTPGISYIRADVSNSITLKPPTPGISIAQHARQSYGVTDRDDSCKASYCLWDPT